MKINNLILFINKLIHPLLCDGNWGEVKWNFVLESYVFCNKCGRYIRKERHEKE